MENHKPLVTYAINSFRQLVYIENVSNGKSCDCFCPYCHARLIAKNNGNVKQHHFAHYDVEDCGKSYETSLHLLAKVILEQKRALMLPAYKDVVGSILQNFDEVETEKRIDRTDMQPDSVGICGNQRFLIEFRVTHEVDEEKKQKIITIGLACIEIDISQQELDREKLTLFLLESDTDRVWINNPQLELLYIKHKKERHETEKLKRQELLKNQQHIIEEYRNTHPDYHYRFVEVCNECPYHSSNIKLREWKASYKGLPMWTDFILKMSPQEIVNTELGIEYTSVDRKPYVNEKGFWHYIYPKQEIQTLKEKRISDITYSFFKKLYSYCLSLLDMKCEHCKKEFEYDERGYIACDYKKKI